MIKYSVKRSEQFGIYIRTISQDRYPYSEVKRPQEWKNFVSPKYINFGKFVNGPQIRTYEYMDGLGDIFDEIYVKYGRSREIVERWEKLIKENYKDVMYSSKVGDLTNRIIKNNAHEAVEVHPNGKYGLFKLTKESKSEYMPATEFESLYAFIEGLKDDS